jgi:hypothetical protein
VLCLGSSLQVRWNLQLFVREPEQELVQADDVAVNEAPLSRGVTIQRHPVLASAVTQHEAVADDLDGRVQPRDAGVINHDITARISPDGSAQGHDWESTELAL